MNYSSVGEYLLDALAIGLLVLAASALAIGCIAQIFDWIFGPRG